VVMVTMNRNLNKPKFETSTYTASVKETLALGNKITTETATDDDKRVRKILYHFAFVYMIYD